MTNNFNFLTEGMKDFMNPENFTKHFKSMPTCDLSQLSESAKRNSEALTEAGQIASESAIARELAKSGSPVGKTSSIQPISLPDLVRLNVSKIDVSSSLLLSYEFFIAIKKLVESDILPESESNPDSLVEDAPASPMYGEIKEPDTEL